MTAPTIVLDCDPGLDDAFAIFVAVEHTNLLGITSVAGNVGVDDTTRNALVVLEAAGSSIPVHRGAAGPMSGPTITATDVHGKHGLGALDQEPTTAPADQDALTFLLDAAESVHDLSIVAVGPLTNIAQAIEARPKFARQIANLTIMGGAARGGNVTATAEFNIFADPEAASIVFNAGIDLTMIGLDVTHQVCMGHSQIGLLLQADTRRSVLAAALLDFYGRSRLESFGTGDGAMHDPCAVLALTHPELFECLPRRVDIELRGAYTRGMTVVDERPHARADPNVNVGYGVDAAAVLRLIVAATTI